MSSQKLKQSLLTQFELPADPCLNYKDSFLFTGSCFAEHMSHKLSELNVHSTSNPFGIIYNPVSLSFIIDRLCSGEAFTEKNLSEINGRFYALDFPGKYNGTNVQELLESLNLIFSASKKSMEECNVLSITLGSSWVYELKTSGKMVANCHKIPASLFRKKLLEENEICISLKKLIADVKNLDTAKKILFTISPVKHLRDGIVENAISKARLLSALYKVMAENPDCKYFPSYEIVTEELRDHRFYETDLAHPNEWTRQYIFMKFIETMFDEKSRNYFTKRTELLQMQTHRVQSNDKNELEKWKTSIDNAEKVLEKEFGSLK